MDGNPQNELNKLQEELEGCNCNWITNLQETYMWSDILMDQFKVCEEDRVKTEVLEFPYTSHDVVDLNID